MSQLRKWLTGAEVSERLNINRLDLLELAKGGYLQPYNPYNGEKLEIVEEVEGFHTYKNIGERPMHVNLVGNGITLRQGRPIVPTKQLIDCCFLVAEVEGIEKRQQKTSPRKEENKNSVNDDTPLGTVREIRLVLPYLEEAIKRKMLKPLLSLTQNSGLNLPDTIFTPPAPASHEEEVILILADMVATLMDDPKIGIDLIISKASPEIGEAYQVVLQEGGGWSSRKGGPDQRRAAVLAWFNRNEARLSFLKKSYLKDPALYNDGAAGKTEFLQSFASEDCRGNSPPENYFPGNY